MSTTNDRVTVLLDSLLTAIHELRSGAPPVAPRPSQRQDIPTRNSSTRDTTPGPRNRWIGALQRLGGPIHPPPPGNHRMLSLPPHTTVQPHHSTTDVPLHSTPYQISTTLHCQPYHMHPETDPLPATSPQTSPPNTTPRPLPPETTSTPPTVTPTI